MDAVASLLLIPFIILGGGIEGSNELIDYAQPQAHWKAKGTTISDADLIGRLQVGEVGDLSPLIKKLGSEEFQTRETAARAIMQSGAGAIPQLKKHLKDKDLEIAGRAAKLIAALEVSDVDRLIAMRVLGERKSKVALPPLQELLASKDPFVAEHAKRAIAMIEGEKYLPPATDSKLLDKDVWLLPSDSIIVAQTTFRGSSPYSVDNLFEELPMIKQAGMNLSETQTRLHEMVRTYAEMIGNIRIDAITIGSNGKFELDSLSVVAVARGLYSPAKLKAVAGKQPGATVRTVDGIDIVEHEEGALILPSKNIVVMVYGNKALRQATLQAVKNGVGSLGDNKPMTTLIKSVDRKSGGWAAIQLNKEMKSQYWLAPYDTITAHRTTSENKRPAIKITCVGKDAEAVKSTAMRFAADIKMIEQFAIQAIQQNQFPKALLELVQSVKVDVDGAKATVMFHAPKGLDTVMSSIAFVPVFALLAGDDLLNF